MSYAFGGYTIYLPRERVQPLDISVEDAMRLAITAGLTAAGPPRSSDQAVPAGARAGFDAFGPRARRDARGRRRVSRWTSIRP